MFHPLTEVEIRAIAGMMLGQVASRLKERAIALTWDDEVVEKLAREGYDVKFGARPLRRLIQRTVEDTLSEELLGRQNRAGRPRAAEGRRWKDYGGEGSIRKRGAREVDSPDTPLFIFVASIGASSLALGASQLR